MRRRATTERRSRPWAVVLALALAGASLPPAGPGARAAPPPFVVNVASDAGGDCQQPPKGDCSLRESILAANAKPGPDRIHFGIPGRGVRTIRPRKELPPLSDPVTIDGFTQAGAKQNTSDRGTNAVLRIEVDGRDVGFSGRGLVVQGGQTMLRGLVVHGFGTGIYLESRPGNWGNAIEGNFVGTDPAGTAPGRRGGYGAIVEGLSSGNELGGTTPAARNLIAGDLDTGIALLPSTEGNFVQGNLLGTDRSGAKNLGGMQLGVQVSLLGTQAVGNWIEGNTIAFV